MTFWEFADRHMVTVWVFFFVGGAFAIACCGALGAGRGKA